MKKIIIYDPFITGHHIEYVYHLLKYYRANNSYYELHLIVCRGFVEKIKDLSDNIVFDKNSVIKIVYLDELVDESNFIASQNLRNYNIQLKYLGLYVDEYKIDHCIFMYIDNALQIALGTNAGRKLNCQISGIVLNPFGGYGVGLKKFYFAARILIQNYIMMSNPKIRGIYIVINPKTAFKLNILHLTKKFIYVSDPILKLHYNQPVLGNLDNTKRINFLLFGSLNKRKGIFKTLRAVASLSDFDLNKIKITFAGKLSEQDRADFECEYYALNQRNTGLCELHDSFISYKEVPHFFSSADYILLPYDATQASSGILGHAAYYKKPIIGQGGGIFEEHVTKFGLGKTVVGIDEAKLAEIIHEIISGALNINVNVDGARHYLELRSGEFFAAQILNNALKN